MKQGCIQQPQAAFPDVGISKHFSHLYGNHLRRQIGGQKGGERWRLRGFLIRVLVYLHLEH